VLGPDLIVDPVRPATGSSSSVLKLPCGRSGASRSSRIADAEPAGSLLGCGSSGCLLGWGDPLRRWSLRRSRRGPRPLSIAEICREDLLDPGPSDPPDRLPSPRSSFQNGLTQPVLNLVTIFVTNRNIYMKKAALACGVIR
jgi:hypothetical protein